MVRSEPIIGVQDVEKSARWYQDLLDCTALHHGPAFEILADRDGTVILCLHKWGDHDHPTLSGSSRYRGHGLILYFRVNMLEPVWQRAQELRPDIEYAPRINPNSGKMEFALKDPDQYYLIISE